jgi:hypothetical protein
MSDKAKTKPTAKSEKTVTVEMSHEDANTVQSLQAIGDPSAGAKADAALAKLGEIVSTNYMADEKGPMLDAARQTYDILATGVQIAHNDLVAENTNSATGALSQLVMQCYNGLSNLTAGIITEHAGSKEGDSLKAHCDTQVRPVAHKVADILGATADRDDAVADYINTLASNNIVSGLMDAVYGTGEIPGTLEYTSVGNIAELNNMSPHDVLDLMKDVRADVMRNTHHNRPNSAGVMRTLAINTSRIPENMSGAEALEYTKMHLDLVDKMHERYIDHNNRLAKLDALTDSGELLGSCAAMTLADSGEQGSPVDTDKIVNAINDYGNTVIKAIMDT